MIKEEPEYQSEPAEDVNKSAASSCDYNLSQFKDEPNFSVDDEEESKPVKEESFDSEEDIPLVSRLFLVEF